MIKTCIKEKLEETKPHAFDTKVFAREKAKGEPEVDMFYKYGYTSIEHMDLMAFRQDMKREGEDITTEEIKEVYHMIPMKDYMINGCVYEKARTTENKRKAVLFLHGGGFFGGDVKTKGNQCKYLAQQTDAVVVSPEYRLSPECAYPGAVQDAMGTLDWMTEHAEMLNIDADHIVVMGESAGGTLAANCCLRDEKNRIEMAVYIYGALDLTPAHKTPYHWDYSLYKMEESQKNYIMNRLFRFKELTEYIEELYLQNRYSATDGEVSPLYAENLEKMPKTLVIEAEFDYFKICNEEFVKKMDAAGKDVEVILYEGLDHGFFDRLGSLPQTADCIREISKRIKEL